MSKKGNTEADGEYQNLHPGAPDIAHPDDDEKWEQQTQLITAFWFEMWERVEARDKKASREARAELTSFLLNSLGQSLRVAKGDKDSIARRWACKLLADVFVGIGKDVGKVRIKKPYGKLMEIKEFRDEMKRIGKVRTDVLFPSQVRAIAQRELKKAGRFRRRLQLLKAGCITVRQQKARYGNVSIKTAEEKGVPLTWEQAATKEKIPKEYWSAMDLPEFSEKHLPRWWKFLWPLVQKNSDKQQLLELSELKYRSARTRYFGDLQKTARDHLKALARLRDKGAFYLF
jgi:hypothetical protein